MVQYKLPDPKRMEDMIVTVYHLCIILCNQIFQNVGM